MAVELTVAFHSRGAARCGLPIWRRTAKLELDRFVGNAQESVPSRAGSAGRDRSPPLRFRCCRSPTLGPVPDAGKKVLGFWVGGWMARAAKMRGGRHVGGWRTAWLRFLLFTGTKKRRAYGNRAFFKVIIPLCDSPTGVAERARFRFQCHGFDNNRNLGQRRTRKGWPEIDSVRLADSRGGLSTSSWRGHNYRVRGPTSEARPAMQLSQPICPAKLVAGLRRP
jgi:hypothetical protein